jgi:hypothetical protein
MGWSVDRSRDITGWLVTPLLTLLAAPVLACLAGILATSWADTAGRPPTLCKEALATNSCEEVTLGVIGAHGVISGVTWLLLWVIPWWRGLRTLRVLLAVAVTVVLVLLLVRLAV